MKKSVIAAVDVNGLIAVNDQIPWDCPEDLKYFRRTTIGNGKNALITGRKTFESLEGPLPGRVNIVVSESYWRCSRHVPGGYVAKTLDEAIHFAINAGCEEAFIIGGHNLFYQGLQLADTLYLTVVNRDCMDTSARSHTYFPSFYQMMEALDDCGNWHSEMYGDDHTRFIVDLSELRENMFD
jgi:dihydrofolate reductase